MADLTYHVVDVFTDVPFAGNPLAVVLGADELSTEQLAALAREFNLSETAFPMRATEPGADYLLRIFTPGSELPFAGHPSVGAAWVMASLGRIAYGDVTMQCGAGLLPLTVTADRVTLTAGTPSAGPPLGPAPFLLALGLSPDDAGGAPARICSTGLRQAFVEVSSPEAVRGVVLDAVALSDAVGSDVETVSVFAWDEATRTAHTRVFAGMVGVGEDPATGSAASAFGAWLAASGYAQADGETSYVVTQGAEIGRPSRMEGTVVTREGVAVECRVAGSVVPIAAGTIRVP
ncbi:MAG TPA: PhzF family phenazine biosynthesis protein [Frankiaceae bacterium]|nr:PhzF family phenazine biosynthesis protein [Frankiaceae bacterium]